MRAYFANYLYSSYISHTFQIEPTFFTNTRISIESRFYVFTIFRLYLFRGCLMQYSVKPAVTYLS